MARRRLALLDAQVARKLGIVAATNLLDEALGALSADEGLNRIPEREVGPGGAAWPYVPSRRGRLRLP